MTPRFVSLAPTPAAGLRSDVELPYHLRPQDILRLVEDLHSLLHDLNGQLHAKGYERLEELLDPAGFSGLVSRAVVDGIHRLSRALVRNEFHNGYPDLLPHGVYPQDRAQHGTQGGLEVKASRNEAGWQAHGPRAGWFCVVQFALDQTPELALRDRSPTQILAVMIASLRLEDWSWQPAKEGKIRSGTASVRRSGGAALRAGAVWVNPSYEERHRQLLEEATLSVLRDDRDDRVRELLAGGGSMSKADLAEALADSAGISDPARLRSLVDAAIRSLAAAGAISSPARGIYRLTGAAPAAATSPRPASSPPSPPPESLPLLDLP